MSWYWSIILLITLCFVCLLGVLLPTLSTPSLADQPSIMELSFVQQVIWFTFTVIIVGLLMLVINYFEENNSDCINEEEYPHRKRTTKNFGGNR